MCMPPHTCGSRRTWELGLSCHQVVPRDQTRVVRFGGKHLDPLSHPTDLVFVLNKQPTNKTIISTERGKRFTGLRNTEGS